MEIIAKKSKSIFFIYFFMLIIGIVTLPLGVYGLFFIKSSTSISYSVWLLSVPIALVGVGGNGLAKHLKFSFTFNLIKLNNDTLIIGKNKYLIKICDLQKVEAEKEFGKTGKLILFTEYEKIQLVSVAQYQLAYARLLELKSLYDEPSKS